MGSNRRHRWWVLLLVGLLGCSKERAALPKAPKVDAKTVCITVVAEYPGAPVEEVERKLLVPLESAMASIDRLVRQEGRALPGVAILKCHLRGDRERAQEDVRTRINETVFAFPADSETYMVYPQDFDARPLVGYVVVSHPDANVPLTETVYDEVRTGLLRQPGIDAPIVLGEDRKQIVLRVDPNKLRAFNLTTGHIRRAIRKEFLDSRRLGDPADKKQSDPKALAKLVLATRPGNAEVLLGDVASVERSSSVGSRLVRIRTRSDGKPREGFAIPVTYSFDIADKKFVANVQTALAKMTPKLSKRTRVDFVPLLGGTTISLEIRPLVGTRFEHCEKLLEKVETILTKQIPEKERTFLYAQIETSPERIGVHTSLTGKAEIVVRLGLPPGEAAQPYIDKLRPLLMTSLVGVRSLHVFEGTRSKPTFRVAIQGDDLEQLDAVAQRTVKRLSTIVGVTELTTVGHDFGPSLRMHVRRERLAELGLSVKDVFEQTVVPARCLRRNPTPLGKTSHGPLRDGRRDRPDNADEVAHLDGRDGQVGSPRGRDDISCRERAE